MAIQTRVFSISLPAEMAKQVETLAKQEQRTISELFREAFRNYRTQRAATAFAELERVAQSRNTNPFGYSEKDIERLVKQTRKLSAAAGKSKRPKVAK